MNGERRNIQQVRTMSQLVDGRRARSSSGALLELSMLEMEKTRLAKERQRVERRSVDIGQRMNEIAAKQHRLMRFVSDPSTATAMPQQPDATDFPVHTELPDRLKRRRLRY